MAPAPNKRWLSGFSSRSVFSDESKHHYESRRWNLTRSSAKRAIQRVTTFETSLGRVAATRAPKHSTYTIDPNRLDPYYDIALIFAILFTAIVTPAEIGFIAFTRNESIDWLFFLNQVVNIIFVIDIFLNFFFAFQLPNDTWVKDHRQIIHHYLCGNFVIDLIASFPYDLIMYMVRSKTIRSLSAMRIMRIIRLLKLLRLSRSSRLIRRYRADISLSFGLINVAYFMIVSLIVAHWIACAWGIVGNASSSIENSWMTPFRDGDFAWSINAPKNQYLISLYMSIMVLTTVGFGDVVPKTLAEYTLLTLAILVGAFIWAFIIGSVCGTIANLDLIKIVHRQRYDQINDLLIDMKIPSTLAHRVRAYLYQSEEVDRHIEYSSLMSYLSPTLQQEIAENLLKKNVCKVHYFFSRTLKFKMAVFKILETRLYCPKEDIATPHLIVIMNNGIVQLLHQNWQLAIRGDALNLDFMIKSKKYRKVPHMRCLSYTEVNILSSEALENLVQFPKERILLLWIKIFYAIRNCRIFYGMPGLCRLASHSLSIDAEQKTTKEIKPTPIDDLQLGLKAMQSGNIVACSERLRDNELYIEIALEHSAYAFQFASLRVRSSLKIILIAIQKAGNSHWREVVLPHVPEDVRDLINYLLALKK